MPKRKGSRPSQLEARNAAAQLRAHDDLERIVELRKKKLSVARICEVMAAEGRGISSRSGVQSALDRALARTVTGADELRARENEKLDHIEDELWRMFFEDAEDFHEKLGAAKELDRVGMRRARINGLMSSTLRIEEVTRADLESQLRAYLDGVDAARSLGPAQA